MPDPLERYRQAATHLIRVASNGYGSFARPDGVELSVPDFAEASILNSRGRDDIGDGAYVRFDVFVPADVLRGLEDLLIVEEPKT